jgi:hypothetical protein
VIQPLYSSTEAGKQLLIYEVVQAPSVFDIAWRIENGDDALFPLLTDAQNWSDDELFQLYMQTLAIQDEQAAALSPIHQLFYHRLSAGRMARFYGDLAHDDQAPRPIRLPDGKFDMAQIRQVQWRINGQHYPENLATIIIRAIQSLTPTQAGMSVIGHGDAHNGNIFFDAESCPPSLLYFDPAFAGRHDPLLDMAKPLFHNVFAMWMYFPAEKTRNTRISLRIEGDVWNVEYDYQLHPVRQMFLKSKVERVLIPLLRLLKETNQLRADWRTYLKSALFCCPFLTMNLSDSAKFTPQMSLLGLAMSIEMGSESENKRSLIDSVLDEVSSSILEM